jgi:5-methylcytosine-specific restriction endonuclease McrA
VVIAEAFLAGKVAAADNPDVYQVIVHVGTDAIASGVSAETPDAEAARTPGHPADPARSHVDDGPAISVSTADMLTCTATLSWILHDHDGTVLDVGRRHRKPTAALRRAVRERDHSRCRYPGCESRRVDLHHIQYWSNGGKTKLINLISLCKHHHTLVHDHGYLIAAGPGGTFGFYTAGGNPVPASPQLPEVEGSIEGCHDADITPGTIIPPWHGEKLDLDYAIAACFAHAEYQARQQDNAGNPGLAARPDEPATEPWRPAMMEVYLPDYFEELRRRKYALAVPGSGT